MATGNAAFDRHAERKDASHAGPATGRESPRPSLDSVPPDAGRVARKTGAYRGGGTLLACLNASCHLPSWNIQALV
jgi:hypothetical protein